MYTYETKKKRGKIVDLSRCSMKKIRELIVFTAFLVVALWKFDVVIEVLKSIWKIVFPFALGGVIAFVINEPMSFLEKKMLGKIKENNKIRKKGCETDKPASYNYIGSRCNGIGNVWCDSTAYADYGKSDDEYFRFYSTDAKLDSRIFT